MLAAISTPRSCFLHSSIAITMETHGHLMQNLHGEVSAEVDGALGTALNRRADNVG